MFGVAQVAAAGKLVALLAVFAPTLAVALAGDGGVTAVGPADAPRGQHHVDRPQHILHPFAVMLNAAGVHEEAGAGCAPHFGRLPDASFGDASHLRRVGRCPLLHMFGHRCKTNSMVVDEVVIQPIIGDHQVQDAIEEGDVSPRLDGQEEVAGAGDGGDAWVNDDDFGPMFPRLPDVIGGDGGALGHVSPANPDNFRAHNVRPGVGGAVNAERFFVTGGSADHAETAVIINIAGAQGHMGELAHQVRFFGGQAGAAEQGEGITAVLALNPLNLTGHAADGLLVTHRLKAAWGR